MTTLKPLTAWVMTCCWKLCCHCVVLFSQSWTTLLLYKGSNCCFLTHIQVFQEIDKVVLYSHLFKSFPQKDFLFLGSKITAHGDCSHKIRRWLLLGRKAMTNLASVLKSRDITLPTNVPIVKAMIFPVVTYICESWIIKKAESQRIDAFRLWCCRRLLRVPWTARRSNQSGNQPWILTGRADAEDETPVFWSPYVNSQLIGKVPDVGKDWEQKENRVSEDEMGGWHYQCIEHELGQTPRDGEGQGGLECYSPWDHKESDMTGRLNNVALVRRTLLKYNSPTEKNQF